MPDRKRRHRQTSSFTTKQRKQGERHLFTNRKPRWQAALWSFGLLLGAFTLAVSPASPAHADPPCKNGGAYVLWVRGSGQSLGNIEAQRFKEHVFGTYRRGVYPKSNGQNWATSMEANLTVNFQTDLTNTPPSLLRTGTSSTCSSAHTATA